MLVSVVVVAEVLAAADGNSRLEFLWAPISWVIIRLPISWVIIRFV